MRILAAAVFLTFVFCAVSAGGRDLAKGSDRKPSSEMFGDVFTFSEFDGPIGAGQVSERTRQLDKERAFQQTLWKERLNAWRNRRITVHRSRPRAAFKHHKHSSSKHYRSSRRGFKSHRHKIKHVRHSRSHGRKKSRR